MYSYNFSSMPVTVRLKPRDVRNAERIADKRGRPTGGEISHEACESYSGPPSSERHLRGVLGEYAFADHYGVPLDSGDELDGGIDFLVRFKGEPTTFDVKATQYPDGKLRVDVDRDNWADYYLHAIVESLEPEMVRLIGMCAPQEVKEAETVEEPSGDLRYTVPVDRLAPLPDTAEIERFRSRRHWR